MAEKTTDEILIACAKDPWDENLTRRVIVQTLAARLLDLTRRVDELERTGRAVRQGVNNRL